MAIHERSPYESLLPPQWVLPLEIGINDDQRVRDDVRLEIRKNGRMTKPEVVYLQPTTCGRAQKFIDLGCGLGVQITALSHRIQIVISLSAGTARAAIPKAA